MEERPTQPDDSSTDEPDPEQLDQEPDYEPDDEGLKDIKGG